VNASTPEHDDLCEAGYPEYFTSACRCAARTAGELDPTLLKMRVTRVRQAREALEKVRHTLATYVSEHADSRCQHALPDAGGGKSRCPAAVDGFILLSCGHFGFLCAYHGSVTLRAVQGGVIDCTATDIDLHPIPARGVTVEWMSLA
jgi:hypothetical protein